MTRCMVRMVIIALVSSAPLLLASQRIPDQSAKGNKAPRLVDLSFPGGTIADYLDALRKQVGKETNIVVTDPRAGEPVLPDISLSGVTVDAAVNLIAAQYRLDNGRKIKVRVEGVGDLGEQQGTPLYRISSIGVGRDTPPNVRVWTVASLIDDQVKADDVLTAVELAVSLAGPGSKPADIRFHEPTSLLVANGSPEQIDAINSVIAQLLESQHQRLEEEARIESMRNLAMVLEQANQTGDSKPAKTPQAQWLSDIERLEQLVQEQAKEIQSLKKRIGLVSPKQ